MPHCTRTKQDVAQAQADMFRSAEFSHNLPLKRIATLSGMSVETLNEYRKGAAMPLHAFVQIAPYIPDELLSLCLAQAGKHVGSDEGDDGDLDALTVEASGLVNEVLEAKRDGSVTHIERARIQQRTRRVVSIGRKVAAA
jgi:hypothetical protein